MMVLYPVRLLLLLIATLAVPSLCELFSSMAHLQTALYAERDIATEIRQYVSQERDRLRKLEQIADEFESHSSLALKDPDFYLGNPVNAYLFVKHFTLDWDRDIDIALKNYSKQELQLKVQELKQYLPTYEDLTGSVNALLRLQDTYKLDTTDIAQGNIGGTKSTELTVEDCFVLGRLAYHEEDYYHTVTWMGQALALNIQNLNRTVNSAEIMDYLAFAEYKRSNQTTFIYFHNMVKCSLILAYDQQTPPCRPSSKAAECFEVGRQAYVVQDYYHTVKWMQEAFDRSTLERNKTMEPTNILDFLTFSLYKPVRDPNMKDLVKINGYDGVRMCYARLLFQPTTQQGNIRRALSLTNEMLSIDPSHSRAQSNKAYYEKIITEEEQNSQKRGDDGDIVNPRQIDEYRSGPEFQKYEALCRGENILENKHRHKLICRYRTNGNPLLMLAPAKEEVVYINPYIALFHDAITDSQIEHVKTLATPKLGRATVHNPKTGKLETATYRVSKSCWLSELDSAGIGKINNMIAAITGLEMRTAEELQVANYGIGGQYEPHFDFARRREPTAFEAAVGNQIATFMYYKEEPNAFQGLGTGNRIATLMFYMSDVQAGGATVFPYLGLKIFPRKGTAVFWYNLFKSGEGIYDTRHAACPVLVGSKWVSNKWIHERGQEFKRPCGLLEEE